MQASERRHARVGLLVALSLLGSACSLVVDFDRSKVRQAGGSTSAGGLPEAGGGSGRGGRQGGGSGGTLPVDGGSGGVTDSGAGGASGGMTDGGADQSAPPPACDVKTHQGCAIDELCCPSTQGPRCETTSPYQCTACGKACPDTIAKSCNGRTCVCDPASNRACTGTGAERLCVQPAKGDPSCVECRDASDCSSRSDDKHECVGGSCVECDPAKGGSGCAGKTPICDATTMACKACSMTPNNCGGSLVCTSSGACGGCASSSTDCATPTTPICDGTTTECRGCSSNAECMSERNLPYCIDSSRCSACQPTTELGCTDPGKPDCRLAPDGNFACQACTSNDQCANLTATPVCDTGSGKCVECGSDNDCTGNSKKPLCVGNACVACDTASISSTADERCTAKPGGATACVRSGTQKGQCGACDPSNSGGCSSSELCCEHNGVAACSAVSATQCTACGVPCNPTLANTCGDRSCQCGASAPCSGTGKQRFCAGSPGSCVECILDADCTDPTAPLCESNQCVGCAAASGAAARCAARSASTPQCATTGARKGRCALCDPTGSAGCGSGGLNQCDPTTATCVDCVDDSGCSGKNDKCDTSANKCVDCTAAGGCQDVPATPVCDTNTCRICGTDAECAAAPGAAGPLCGSTGACGTDAECTGAGDCTDGVHGICLDINRGTGSVLNRCRACNPDTNAGCATGTCGADFLCGP